jgi:hypothetical protein
MEIYPNDAQAALEAVWQLLDLSPTGTVLTWTSDGLPANDEADVLMDAAVDELRRSYP